MIVASCSKSSIVFILGILTATLAFFIFTNFVSATSEADIVYPIAELGGCPDKEACFAYCDDLTHKDACLAFAEKHNLIPEEELELARKIPGAGPGGCRTHDACEQYCSDPAHGEECLAFAERYGLIPPEELQIVRTVLKDGGPGGCRTKEQCEKYCSQDANFEVCFEFGKKHGLIKPEEEEAFRKIGNKPGPGGCRRQECRDYCENPDHFEECINFAEENNLIPPEEAARARKLGNRPGPGGCRGEQCRTYCEKPENMDVCIQFAVDNGFMTPSEAERALKFKNISGPGGCRGEECRTFCENPEHQEECFRFAKDNGFIPPEDLERMEAEKLKFGQELEKFPEEVKVCLKEKLGPLLEQIKAGEFNFSPRIGEAIRICFEQFRPPESFPHDQGPPPPFDGIPGICQTPEECIKYCSLPEHREECAKFNPSSGGGLPPGGTFREGAPVPYEFSPPPKSTEFLCEPYVCADGAKFPACSESGPINYLVDPCQDHGGRVFEQNYYQNSSPTPEYSPTLAPTYESEPYYNYTPVPEPDPPQECARRGGAWDSELHSCRFPEQSSSLLLRAAAFISNNFSRFLGF